MPFYKLYKRRTDYDHALYLIDRMRFPEYYAKKDAETEKAIENLFRTTAMMKAMMPKGVFNP